MDLRSRTIAYIRFTRASQAYVEKSYTEILALSRSPRLKCLLCVLFLAEMGRAGSRCRIARAMRSDRKEATSTVPNPWSGAQPWE